MSTTQIIEAGDIITYERKNVRVQQLSDISGRALVYPVKHNRNGIVRCGKSVWIDLP